MKTAIEFLEVLAWPLIALFMFLAVRQPLSKLISGLRPKRASTPWGTYEFDTLVPGGAAPAGPPDLAGRLQRDKTGNLYWLGHDLMWTKDAILRGAPRQLIVHGLKKSLQNLRSVGLANTPQEAILVKLLERASGALEAELDRDLRASIASEIGHVTLSAGQIACDTQSEFESSPLPSSSKPDP